MSNSVGELLACQTHWTTTIIPCHSYPGWGLWELILETSGRPKLSYSQCREHPWLHLQLLGEIYCVYVYILYMAFHGMGRHLHDNNFYCLWLWLCGKFAIMMLLCYLPPSLIFLFPSSGGIQIMWCWSIGHKCGCILICSRGIRLRNHYWES